MKPFQMDFDKQKLIEEKSGAFTIKELETFVTVFDYFRTHGIEPIDLRNFVVTVKETRVKQMLIKEEEAQRNSKNWETRGPKCPKCKSSLYINAINTPEGPANRNGYKSVWTCGNDDCFYQRFSKITVRKEMRGAGFSVRPGVV